MLAQDVRAERDAGQPGDGDDGRHQGRCFSEQDGDFPCHILRLGKNDLGMLIGHRMSTGWDSFGSAAESRMGVSYC